MKEIENGVIGDIVQVLSQVTPLTSSALPCGPVPLIYESDLACVRQTVFSAVIIFPRPRFRRESDESTIGHQFIKPSPRVVGGPLNSNSKYAIPSTPLALQTGFPLGKDLHALHPQMVGPTVVSIIDVY